MLIIIDIHFYLQKMIKTEAEIKMRRMYLGKVHVKKVLTKPTKLKADLKQAQPVQREAKMDLKILTRQKVDSKKINPNQEPRARAKMGIEIKEKNFYI